MKTETNLLVKDILNILNEEGIVNNKNNYLISLIYEFLNNKKVLINYDSQVLLAAKEMNNYIKSVNLKKIYKILENINLEDFNDLIYDILSINKEDRVIIESSNENVINLVYKLLEINDNESSVFDLGSGIGKFLSTIYKLANEDGFNIKNLIGVEINREDALISQMVLNILCNSTNKPIILNMNGLDENNYKYNKGYVFPPLGIKDNDKELNSKLFSNIKFTFRNSTEWKYIDSLLQGLQKPNNKAVALVSGRTLFNDADIDYRNNLIKNGLLEGIIELPAGTLSFTGIKVFLLIFSSNNKEVKFLDASNIVCADNKRYSNLELPVETIYDLYCSNNIKTIKNEILINKTNLIPSVSLLDVIEIDNGVILGECADVITGNQYTLGVFEKKGLLSKEKTNYRILTSSDIDNGYVDMNSLKYVNLKDNKFDRTRLHKGDLIITSKSSKVKSVVIDEEPNESVIVTGGMLIVRIKEKLNPTYLKVFLDSKEGQNVLKSIQKGVTIVTINASSLESINVPLISLEEQNKVATEYNQLLMKHKNYKKKLSELEKEIEEFRLNY